MPLPGRKISPDQIRGVIGLPNIIILLVALILSAGAALAVIVAMHARFRTLMQTMTEQFALADKALEARLAARHQAMLDESQRQTVAVRTELAQSRAELGAAIGALRDSLQQSILQFSDSTRSGIQSAAAAHQQSLDAIRQALDSKLLQMQNLLKSELDSIRKTVDEKLQSTLERRIGESFKTVSEQLQAVQKGLGEMITVAESARDLKNVFMNIKSRGGLGELQLEAVLQNMLSPGQFQLQYAPGGGREKVDAVICLPGSESGHVIMLPIDAKFPLADAQRLFEAQQSGDAEAMKTARTGFESLIRREAKSISEKYIRVPETTDFAVMFLPSESLFAEAVRSPELLDDCHRQWKILIAGPASLWAILSSLRMGFRTLAIQSHAAEVQKRLDIVKNEFTKFRGLLDKLGRHLNSARDTLSAAEKYNRQMERSLDIEAASDTANAPLLAAESDSATLTPFTTSQKTADDND